MIHHLNIHSVISALYRLTYFLAIATLVLLCSCQNTSKTDNHAANQKIISQHQKALTSLADNALLAIAARHYENIPDLLDPAQRHLTHKNIMTKLIGPHFNRVTIMGWNAQKFNITVNNNLTHATVATPITYRRHPSRKIKKATLLFNCVRNQNQWLIVLPE